MWLFIPCWLKDKLSGQFLPQLQHCRMPMQAHTEIILKSSGNNCWTEQTWTQSPSTLEKLNSVQQKSDPKPGMVVHTCNPSTREVEV
jgi:hypothetical protein